MGGFIGGSDGSEGSEGSEGKEDGSDCSEKPLFNLDFQKEVINPSCKWEATNHQLFHVVHPFKIFNF